jgi:hypothetical protein
MTDASLRIVTKDELDDFISLVSSGSLGPVGPQGNVGPAGPIGLPGVNAVPADSAVAGYLSAAGSSQSRAVLDAIILAATTYSTTIGTQTSPSLVTSPQLVSSDVVNTSVRDQVAALTALTSALQSQLANVNALPFDASVSSPSLLTSTNLVTFGA